VTPDSAAKAGRCIATGAHAMAATWVRSVARVTGKPEV